MAGKLPAFFFQSIRNLYGIGNLFASVKIRMFFQVLGLIGHEVGTGLIVRIGTVVEYTVVSG